MPPTNQGQNLVNPTAVPLPSTITGKPAGFYKSMVLDVLSILTAFAVGYSYHEYLVSGMSPLIVVGVFLIFGILSALQALLCKEVGRRAFIILCEVAVLSSFFYALYAVYAWFFIAAAASAFIFFFWGYLGSRSEIGSSMDVRPFRAMKGAVGKVMTGTIIFMIVIYIPLWNQNSIFIPQKSFDVVFDWGAGVFNSFYPTFPLSGSVEIFVNSVVRAQLENAASSSFQNLSFGNQNALVAQNTTSIIDNLSKDLGITIQPTGTISATIYQFIIKTLLGWKDRFQWIFLAGWGVALFFVARSVGIIFVWIDQFFFLFIYEILLASRFMRIKGEERTKEVVGY
jgi:hypothetical protein